MTAARNDREFLTRRGLEQLFGVSKARAAILMRTFGAERTGNPRTLARTSLLRQLRARRKGAAFSGEADCRERVVTALRQARIAGIRMPVATDVFSPEARRVAGGHDSPPRAHRSTVYRSA